MTDTKISDERLAQLVRLHPAGSPIRTRFNRDVHSALIELQRLRHQEPGEPGDWQVKAALSAYQAAYPDGTSRAGEQGMRAALRAASIPKVEPTPPTSEGERYPTADRHYDDIDDPRKTGLADLIEPDAPRPAPVVTVPNEKWADREPIYDVAIAAYEANTPPTYRYSAIALTKAVDAAIVAIEASLQKQEIRIKP